MLVNKVLKNLKDNNIFAIAISHKTISAETFLGKVFIDIQCLSVSFASEYRTDSLVFDDLNSALQYVVIKLGSY